MNVKPSDSSPQASLSVDILCEADYIICLRLTTTYFTMYGNKRNLVQRAFWSSVLTKAWTQPESCAKGFLVFRFDQKRGKKQNLMQRAFRVAVQAIEWTALTSGQ